MKYLIKTVVYVLLGTVFTFSVLKGHPWLQAFQCAVFCFAAGVSFYMFTREFRSKDL